MKCIKRMPNTQKMARMVRVTLTMMMMMMAMSLASLMNHVNNQLMVKLMITQMMSMTMMINHNNEIAAMTTMHAQIRLTMTILMIHKHTTTPLNHRTHAHTPNVALVVSLTKHMSRTASRNAFATNVDNTIIH